MLRRIAATCLASAVLSTALVACSRSDEAAELLEAFLTGWPTGELDEVPFITPAGSPVPSAEVAQAIAELSGELGEHPPQLTAGELARDNGSARAEFTVDWPLPAGDTWSYPSRVRLADGDGGWRVIWEPAAVHPELLDGDAIALRRQLPPRAAILDGAGEPLITAQPVRVVGVWPSRVEDIDTVVDELDGAFRALGHDHIQLDDLPDRVDDALENDLFVAVLTLRDAEYQEIAGRLEQVPGILVQQAERQLAPTRTFAQALLGTVGEVFAEDLQEGAGEYLPGDLIGRGGLQERYEQQLRGSIGYTVVIDRPAPGDATNEAIELAQFEPRPGTDLATTLDRDVQLAAEEALAADSRTAALVAIRVSDGAVLAVANTQGEQAHPVNLALTASVPPGSTFKLVSAYQLLASGELALDTPVGCPPELTVDGFTITTLVPASADIPFQQALAISCNTAFAELAPRLGDTGLADAGAALGIGGEWDLGIGTFTGSVPTGGSAAAQAVAAFGQGDTQVSPAAMAAATAAVARGSWLPPTLVMDPEAPAGQPEPLPEQAIADLHTALRAVVTDGTGTGLLGVPGGDVYGKTGSAEADPETTHAWFVGWQGDVAFAVFVEDGRSGSGAAVPLAADFLRELAG